jgi:protein TonB
MRLGLAPVGPSTDPKATPGTEQPAPPKPETPAAEAAQPEPSQPERQAAEPEPAAQHEPPEPQVQQALAAPPPPPPPAPSLEKALPPIEAPPPPVTSQDVPRPAPPPPPPKPPPAQHQPQRAQPAPPAPKPPPQQQALQSSPLSNLPRAPADRQASRQAPTFVNPADMYGQKRAEDEYLWYVARKLSQHQQFVRNASTESGTVVLRLVIARDGRLIDVGLSRSSGVPSLDNVSLSMIRQAAPYPPLPPEIQGAQHTFTLPLYYKRNE